MIFMIFSLAVPPFWQNPLQTHGEARSGFQGLPIPKNSWSVAGNSFPQTRYLVCGVLA